MLDSSRNHLRLPHKVLSVPWRSSASTRRPFIASLAVLLAERSIHQVLLFRALRYLAGPGLPGRDFAVLFGPARLERVRDCAWCWTQGLSGPLHSSARCDRLPPRQGHAVLDGSSRWILTPWSSQF